ncbi:branched-chain amino acid ABC transporter permease [Aquabacterium sp.]|uniref:branched-chain amino acid ABC transporter permease n=1 Tax=Aquabacterium sp. TaxID=1872578 RepID=UPI002BEC1711|nr:branched-chain amino acid ABC transporter permease [Aquabacterium sp.]HSW04409.1 branched-chain amino acid ABC transporter permease [Aquabacterium sp.]
MTFPPSPVHRPALALGLVALLIAPTLVYPVFMMKLLCFALLAASLNLLVGYVGLLSFGHAMFFGSAAYVSAHAIKVWGFDVSLGILAGVATAAALGATTGLLAIRRQGIAFSMITLAFAQLVYFVALQLPFTGGEDGIQNVPRRPLFGLLDLGNNMTLYYVVLTIAVLGFWLAYRIVYSPFGQVLKAIRDNEPRAISLGYKVNRYKLLAFTLSAALAGLAGATKVVVFQIATLTDVGFGVSGEAVLMSILGGIQTMLGPIVGALISVTMQNYLAGFAEWVLILQGVVFVVVVLVFPRGIVGEYQAWRLRKRASRQALASPSSSRGDVSPEPGVSPHGIQHS